MLKEFRIAYKNQSGLNNVFCCIALSQNMAVRQFYDANPWARRPVSAGIKAQQEFNPILSICCSLGKFPPEDETSDEKERAEDPFYDDNV